MAPVSNPDKDMDAPDGGEFAYRWLFRWVFFDGKAKKLADM